MERVTAAAEVPAAEQKLHGVVREWRGSFGFITSDDGKRIFVHQSDLLMPGYRELQPGQRVAFMVSQDERGRLRAEDVEVVEGLTR